MQGLPALLWTARIATVSRAKPAGDDYQCDGEGNGQHKVRRCRIQRRRTRGSPAQSLEPLQAATAHAVLRTDLAIGGRLAPSQARRKGNTVLFDHGSYRLAWLPDHIGEVWFGLQTSLGRLTRIELGSPTDGRLNEP